MREPVNYHPLCGLSGTPPRGCSVFERYNDGLRLRAAGSGGRTVGRVLDPARVDIQEVKCDGARCRSAFPNDGKDRAEGRATLINDDEYVRTDSQMLQQAGALVRKSGRISYRLARSCGGSGAFSHRGGIRAEGQPALSTGGRARAEDRPLFEPMGAFGQSLGRTFAQVRAIVQMVG